MRTIAYAGIFAVVMTTPAHWWNPAAGADSPSKANAEALNAWREARFGMFIHWGPVSLTEKEISWSRANSNPKCPNNGPTPVADYDNLYRRFNPTKFDAKQWVAVAKAAGMKYMILTAKHCDGFLLWDSKVDPYNITRTPFKRDVCAELAKAAQEAGMRIGWYFSPMDWRDPDFRTDRNARFVSRMQSEVRELLTTCGRIDLLWFDWDGHEPLYDQEHTYQIVKDLQPRIVINNRLDLGGARPARDRLDVQGRRAVPGHRQTHAARGLQLQPDAVAFGSRRVERHGAAHQSAPPRWRVRVQGLPVPRGERELFLRAARARDRTLPPANSTTTCPRRTCPPPCAWWARSSEPSASR